LSAFATACERVPPSVVLLALLAADLMLAVLSMCVIERLTLLLMPPPRERRSLRQRSGNATRST
jgi:hypothetical protein